MSTLFWYMCILYRVFYRGQHRTPSCNRKWDRASQNDYEIYIRQRSIPRHSLLSVKRCPWRRVFNSGDPQALITLTGFDMESFMYICASFRPLWRLLQIFAINLSSCCWRRNIVMTSLNDGSLLLTLGRDLLLVKGVGEARFEIPEKFRSKFRFRAIFRDFESRSHQNLFIGYRLFPVFFCRN
jgi:hypothetical protein